MPELRIDVDAIGRNTEVVAALLRRRGLDLVAVTKGCLGEPRVAAAMLAGGAVALADTRDLHLRRLRAALPDAELHRIDLPSPTGRFEPGDVTYVSSWEGVQAVAAFTDGGDGGPPGHPRRVMVVVETGDEREGVPEERLPELAAAIGGERRLVLEGVATNYACFRGRPEGLRASVERVARCAVALRDAGLPVKRVSGGNSSLLWLIARGEELPGPVTEVRCGEALLLGQDALFYEPLPDCSRGACTLRAEVLEEYTRPAPAGPSRRLLLGLGKQDLGQGAVEFVEPGVREIGRSSDYLVVEADAEPFRPRVGSVVEMIPGYEALVAAWMSPYVDLRLQEW